MASCDSCASRWCSRLRQKPRRIRRRHRLRWRRLQQQHVATAIQPGGRGDVADQEGVAVVDVVGANGEVPAVDPIADDELAAGARALVDPPAVLGHLDRAAAFDREVLNVARVLADQVRAGRPGGHRQLGGPVHPDEARLDVDQVPVERGEAQRIGDAGHEEA